VDTLPTEMALPGLLLARCGGLMALAPPLNARQVPLTLRVGAALVLAVALLPVAEAAPLTERLSPGHYLALLVGEAAVGLAMGLGAGLAFWAFSIAGQLLDALLGTGDPGERASGQGPVAGFLYLLAGACLLAIDGHHWLLEALADGLRAMPLGTSIVADASVIRDAVAVMLAGGVLIAAPVLAAIYAADVAVAAFDRVAPGLGLTDCASPVRWTSGLLGLVVTTPLLARLVADHGRRAAEAASRALQILAGGP